ncbi:FG-GAP-like repeat-containing protein [Streptomyces sp. NPDC051569]|uniref:FG-GAP-like repeat-containing protein n=1 Tax=Streptomyces sp. NPDC051569 TaxID=3365661 RepID=UPI00378C271B
MAALVVAALGATLLVAEPGGGDGGPGAKRAARPAAGPLDEDAAQEKAVRSGKRVEVTALRSATSTTFARPDGSFELTSHAAPVRAKVGGTWKPIDTTLVRTDKGWAPKASADPAVFSAGGGTPGGTRGGAKRASAGGAGSVHPASFTVPGSGAGSGAGSRATPAATAAPAAARSTAYTELVTFTSAGHEVTVSWPGPLPEPVIDGASALYPGVFDGVDLLLTARDSGFSHLLVVHSAQAAAAAPLDDLAYRLTSPDLTFHLDPVTRVVSAQDDAGQEIVVSPTPYMWDSAGKPAVTEGADPEPAEPAEPSAPAYSEEPGAEVGEESEPPSDGLDTEGPEPGALPESPTTPAPTPDPEGSPGEEEFTERTAYGSHGRAGAAARVHTATRVGDVPRTGDTIRADAATAGAVLTPGEVLSLPGLAGPQPGTHAAVGDAALTGQGATSAELTVVSDDAWLAGKDTVWPAFIDPSLTGKTKNWTTAYKKYPDSSFYDGANYNSGTTEARVGYESTTGGLSRSYFRLGWTTSFKGATVTSATIRLRETYAWGCENREMELGHTAGISSSTTWNRQPAWKRTIGAKSFANGYNSTCPDAYVTYDGKSIAQEAADGGWTDFTIGMRASNESSSASWKKFTAEGESAPKITIVYNRKPKTPTSLDMNPGPTCESETPYPTIGKRDLVLSAASSDPDDTSTSKDLKYLDFELWRVNYSDTKILDTNVAVSSTGKASVTVPASKLTNGYTYSWRVRAIDSTGAGSAYAPANDTGVCRFIFDSSAPNAPVVSSTEFPAADADGTVWSLHPLGAAGSFTFDPDGETDIASFQYSFNSTSYSNSKPATKGKSLTLPLTPPAAGPHILYVRSVDGAGNYSAGTKYYFYVRPKASADTPGDVSGDGIPDLYVITDAGNMYMYPSTLGGDIHTSLKAAHVEGTPIQSIEGNGYWKDSGGKPALIAHGGDGLPGDGITDMFARMPDGKLYVFPGDGYGSFDTGKRELLRLPANAPATSTFDQIIVGDYNLDRRPDVFATTQSGALWLFTGYTGASFRTATQMNGSAWGVRDLVSVGDHNKDGAPDLVWRSEESDRLYIRHGVKDGTNGSTVASLSTAAASLMGVDTPYAEGWSETTMPVARLYGTPDVTGDAIPDIWSQAPDGSIKLYKGGASALGAGTTVISVDSDWDINKIAFG